MNKKKESLTSCEFQVKPTSAFSALRFVSYEDRSRPPAPASPAAEVSLPTTQTSAWRVPPPQRSTTWALTTTSFTARCLPAPSTPPCPLSVTSPPAWTARAARTVRQTNACGHTRTRSSCTAAWCVQRGWTTEARRRQPRRHCGICLDVKTVWSCTGQDRTGQDCCWKLDLY